MLVKPYDQCQAALHQLDDTQAREFCDGVTVADFFQCLHHAALPDFKSTCEPASMSNFNPDFDQQTYSNVYAAWVKTKSIPRVSKVWPTGPCP